MASFKSGYSLESIAKIPAYINGVTSQNPSIALASSGLSFGHSTSAGFHIVSPTFASRIVLRPVTTYPIDHNPNLESLT
jgi:hypothetical protein